MAAFGGLILTNKGRNVLAKAQTGKQLKITKVVIGDGKLGSTESIADLSNLKNQIASFNIAEIKIIQNKIAKIIFVFNNNQIESGFYWREIGVIVEEPDTKEEVLYCYGNAGDNGDYIAQGGGVDVLEKYVNVDIIVENASNVSAIIDGSLIFASKQELEEYVDNRISNSETYYNKLYRYRMDIENDIPAGSEITLPCYYWRNPSNYAGMNIEIRCNTEVMLQAHEASFMTDYKEIDGHYYEIDSGDDTTGVYSNKIKLANDCSLKAGDVLILTVQGYKKFN